MKIKNGRIEIKPEGPELKGKRKKRDHVDFHPSNRKENVITPSRPNTKLEAAMASDHLVWAGEQKKRKKP